MPMHEVLEYHYACAREPEVRELFQLERMHDSHSTMAQVLREDEVRRERVLRALERFVVGMPPCAERDALALVGAAEDLRGGGAGVALLAGGAWREFACARPEIVRAFYYYLNPGGLAEGLRELEAAYAELDVVLR